MAKDKTPLAHRWWWLPAIYLVFLAYQSLVAEHAWSCKRNLSLSLIKWSGFGLSDFLANFLAYAPLGFLLAAPKLGERLKWALIFATGLGFCFSLLMESLQLCIPGRTSSLYDLLSNTLGALAGALLAWLWHFWEEGRVATPRDAKDLPLALKSSALRILVILATLTWIAYQTKPWVFTLDVGQLRANFSWLKRLHELNWSWFAFLRHSSAWMAMLLAWRLSASVRPSRFLQGSQTGQWMRWSLFSLGFAVLSQIGLAAKALGPEELLGMACSLLAVGILSLLLAQIKHIQSLLSLWVILFAMVTVFAYQLEPGLVLDAGFADGTKKFSLLPKLGTHQLIHAIDYALFFAWFGVMLAVAVCARTSANVGFQKLSSVSTRTPHSSPGSLVFALGWKVPLVALLVVTATEIAQLWIPGRGADTSPMIFTLLGYLFANRMVSRTRPII